jgi:hypothetical protein
MKSRTSSSEIPHSVVNSMNSSRRGLPMLTEHEINALRQRGVSYRITVLVLERRFKHAVALADAFIGQLPEEPEAAAARLARYRTRLARVAALIPLGRGGEAAEDLDMLYDQVRADSTLTQAQRDRLESDITRRVNARGDVDRAIRMTEDALGKASAKRRALLLNNRAVRVLARAERAYCQALAAETSADAAKALELALAAADDALASAEESKDLRDPCEPSNSRWIVSEATRVEIALRRASFALAAGTPHTSDEAERLIAEATQVLSWTRALGDTVAPEVGRRRHGLLGFAQLIASQAASDATRRRLLLRSACRNLGARLEALEDQSASEYASTALALSQALIEQKRFNNARAIARFSAAELEIRCGEEHEFPMALRRLELRAKEKARSTYGDS